MFFFFFQSNTRLENFNIVFWDGLWVGSRFFWRVAPGRQERYDLTTWETSRVEIMTSTALLLCWVFVFSFAQRNMLQTRKKNNFLVGISGFTFRMFGYTKGVMFEVFEPKKKNEARRLSVWTMPRGLRKWNNEYPMWPTTRYKFSAFFVLSFFFFG
jgi:hypothetical protein